MKSVESVQRHILETFEARTSRSRKLYERALRSLPGGDTRSSVYYRPYPIFMQRGEGCRLHDGDGNDYLDLLNNYTTLVHGHAHPQITRAMTAQAAGERLMRRRTTTRSHCPGQSRKGLAPWSGSDSATRAPRP